MTESIIGWTALTVFICVLVAQFYVYYAARHLIARIRKEDSRAGDETSAADNLSARARIKWLRDNRSNIPGGILPAVERALRIDALSFVLFGILILLWAAGVLIG